MRRSYERPTFLIETFATNRSVATTTSCGKNQTATLECFIGDSTDRESVLMYVDEQNSCTYNGKFFNGAETAYCAEGKTGSTVGGTTYAAPEGAVGLFCICSSGAISTVVKNADAWSMATGSTQATHTAISNMTTADGIHKISNSSSSPWDFGGGGSSSQITTNNARHCQVAPVYSVNIGIS